MASGDYGKPQNQYEKQTSGSGGGNKAQNVATQDGGQLSGIAGQLEREFSNEPWYGSAINQIVPLFRQLKQAQGDTVCLEQHGPNVSIMKQRQTSQGSPSR